VPSEALVVFFTIALWWNSYRQWGVSRDSMQVSMRAYLNIGNLPIYCPVREKPGGLIFARRIPPEADAAIHRPIVNTGRTPGRSIEINPTTYGYAGPITRDYSFKEMNDQEAMAGDIAADPAQPLTIVVPFAAFELVSAGGEVPVHAGTEATIPAYSYIYGHISFTDVFDHRHTLLHCVQYAPPTTANHEEWVQCPAHNGEDDR
jgi:hypothetical protein